MKKYIHLFFIALVVSFFLANLFLNQYEDYKGIKVSSEGEILYFIQYGVFSTKESMEENTIELENYIYNKEADLYYVYVGITKNPTNAEKIIQYYKSKGFDTILKEYQINNKLFFEKISSYDQLLLDTNDEMVISSLISDILTKYEEVVINGN